jgi:hypothetical protein
MAKKQKRDLNSYWLPRFEVHHPAIHDDLVNRRITLAEARRRVGWISDRTSVHELKNAWLKATTSQKRTFVNFILNRSSTNSAAKPAPKPFATDGRLEPWAATRIRKIMASRNMSTGQLMDELRLSRLNASIGNALKNGVKLAPGTITRLEKWVDDNARER